MLWLGIAGSALAFSCATYSFRTKRHGIGLCFLIVLAVLMSLLGASLLTPSFPN